MHECEKKLNLVKDEVNKIVDIKQLKTKPNIIAVTKTFPLDKIFPLIEIGHIHFGENKIQEAELKWMDVKNKYKNIQLHMIGKLQSNKIKKAVQLFDYIHSLDNEKMAKKLNHYNMELNKKTKLFIQVNLGEENQKSGILINDVDSFYEFCTKELSLDIIGLMCLPPMNSDSNKYFTILKKKSNDLGLKNLSMGMSSDYRDAVSNGSTFLRLGTEIFGKRDI